MRAFHHTLSDIMRDQQQQELNKGEKFAAVAQLQICSSSSVTNLQQ
jgi:hypothetical protein